MTETKKKKKVDRWEHLSVNIRHLLQHAGIQSDQQFDEEILPSYGCTKEGLAPWLTQIGIKGRSLPLALEYAHYREAARAIRENRPGPVWNQTDNTTSADPEPATSMSVNISAETDVDDIDTGPIYSPLNIYQRLHAVMEQCLQVEKAGQSAGGWDSYAYIQFDDLLRTIRPELIKYGVVMLTDVEESSHVGNMTHLGVRADFVCIDRPNDRMSVRGYGQGCSSEDKGPGIAFTYACKQILLKVLLLPGGKADDAEAHREPFKPQKASGATPPASKAPIVRETPKPASEDDLVEERRGKALMSLAGWAGVTISSVGGMIAPALERCGMCETDGSPLNRKLNALEWATLHSWIECASAKFPWSDENVPTAAEMVAAGLMEMPRV